ncbi:permease [Halocynthiibacter sp.]|uniref:permease n=1 Tax=Halocynthiibacter sp. TaxID=1979210 RepID=UPI003C448660
MSNTCCTAPSKAPFLVTLWREQRVWLASLTIFTLLVIFDITQAEASFHKVMISLAHTGPYLLLSISIAAWAGASNADRLIAKAFTGTPALMIVLGAVAGGLSPFCSCGVIPLIAALLAMRVPLSAVMAFWLASPVMDPSMFFLTSGVLGFEFAIAKTCAAIGLGVFGGITVHILSGTSALKDPLKEGVAGGCGAASVQSSEPVVWAFWKDAERRKKFISEAVKTTLFLGKWLIFAFLLESLMLAWIPAEMVTKALGGTGIGPIAVATFVGVPAYLNGYAALPLIGGLIEQGMAPGAGLAFLVAGGVTSLPAAIAVWALVKPKVFGLYILLSLSGAFLAGVLFQVWQAV